MGFLLRRIGLASLEKAKGASMKPPFEAVMCFGDPGAIRTPDPQLRRLLLYPAELRNHFWITSRKGKK